MDFRSGNEMAAKAAAQINYHLMGYFPITPSTEIAEYLEEMKSNGEHDIKLIPADGEHGSAGICYGAATAGGRVFNATSANGFLYMLEQLPVQSGTRFPMVLNLVTRSVSGPLDIRGDHSDLYYALNTGWPILMARDPQAVYDMNLIALKVAEHADVRLPVIVASDGFFTSHQKRRVHYFEDRKTVEGFVGKTGPVYVDSTDTKHPVTIGPYMNDPDYINNKYQQSEAMYRAGQVFLQIAAEYEELSGRHYGLLDTYRMEDADIALLLLNSAADTAKDAADRLRLQGVRAGVVSPNVIRPFPKEALQKALSGVKVVLMGERADSYGAYGGNLSHELKSALLDAGSSASVYTRIYGLGGKDFYLEDALSFYELCLDALAGKEVKRFDYHGHTPGTALVEAVKAGPLSKAETSGFISVTRDEATGELKVKMPTMRALTAKAKRIAPGHGACPGCGIFSGLDMFFKGIEGDVVVLYHTGCAMVVTTGYPYSAHKVNYIHNLFQNGSATLSGVVEMFWERFRRGEVQVDESNVTFVMITGDGGMDIGMGPAIGTALRNHRLIILEYDNEGYMNTGAQLSYSTPMGHMTSTSAIGGGFGGKPFHHKDTAQIMASTNIPYVFTGTEAFPQDLIKKAAKAQWYARHEGTVYGKILISCPLNWKAKDDAGTKIVETAVNSCFFPLYEVEHGVTKITYNPEDKKKRVSLNDWLSLMGKTKHLLLPEHKSTLEAFEDEVERRWNKLKAKHESPYL
ncbi:thiamine pyrophosphate-dependent enzyme [Paenibacillus larvae]